MESGREEGKNPSSTSWGENLRQTVFVEMLAKEAEHLLYYRKGAGEVHATRTLMC